MHDDALLEAWEEQFALLLQTAKEVGVEAKPFHGSQAVALTFCEKLILCPTLDSASRCMQSDQEGAGAFLYEASRVDWLFHEQKTRFPNAPSELSTPFYLICAAAWDMLNQMREHDPKGFELE